MVPCSTHASEVTQPQESGHGAELADQIANALFGDIIKQTLTPRCATEWVEAMYRCDNDTSGMHGSGGAGARDLEVVQSNSQVRAGIEDCTFAASVAAGTGTGLPPR